MATNRAYRTAQGRHTFIIPAVLDEVLFEDAHEDGGQEAGQQQHRHTRVDDAEPVDLRPGGTGTTSYPAPPDTVVHAGSAQMHCAAKVCSHDRANAESSCRSMSRLDNHTADALLLGQDMQPWASE